jgi:predicted 3-demethylubiquinone-9 3-methyltransferase (glyoxalase superfamily)
MQKIVPHLWYAKEAKEAAEFYVKTFGENSKITHVSTIHDTPTPSGDSDIVSFDILGFSFMAISAGPVFTLNPSISFHVVCKTKERVDELCAELSKDGKVLMELGEYPFSKRYGWVQDKFGLSWQIIYFEDVKDDQRVIPIIMFTQDLVGNAEKAINFYADVFKNAPNTVGITEVRGIMRYNKGEEPDKEGAVRYADFSLAGIKMGAMESGHEHNFKLNEAISLLVLCETQEEVDYFWEKLSAVKEAEQCGWCKDEFGVSWQIHPKVMDEMMTNGTPEQVNRVTQAFLQMKKFDIAKLQEAYNKE